MRPWTIDKGVQTDPVVKDPNSRRRGKSDAVSAREGLLCRLNNEDINIPMDRCGPVGCCAREDGMKLSDAYSIVAGAGGTERQASCATGSDAPEGNLDGRVRDLDGVARRGHRDRGSRTVRASFTLGEVAQGDRGCDGLAPGVARWPGTGPGRSYERVRGPRPIGASSPETAL